VSHTVDVGLEVVVAGDAGGGGELLVGVYVAEMVAVAPFRGAAGLNEACQDTALQRFGANLLAIKPQIIMANGSMSTGKKYRGNIERAIQAYVEDTLKEFPDFDPSLIFITTTMDANKQGIIETVRKRLEKEGFERIEVTTAGGTIACHCGPNTLGILYLNDGPHPIAE
jgi:hypothetical protein